jgi:hypothetical protein
MKMDLSAPKSANAETKNRRDFPASSGKMLGEGRTVEIEASLDFHSTTVA